MITNRYALDGFTKLRDDELLVQAKTILQALDNNAHYPDPLPALVDVLAQVTNYEAKLAIARKKGDPEETVIKNDSRKPVENSLFDLAFYVNKMAGGDLAKLLSSGFEISAYRKDGTVPEVVNNIRLKDGKQSGQMCLNFEKQKNAQLYEYCIAHEKDEADNLIWSEPFTTFSCRNNIIAPLIPLTPYWVRVRAVNRQGKSDWSPLVTYAVH